MEVDIKSSHVYCLLALLKDISINYFSGNGSHEERLERCQFSRQIAMFSGLDNHLRQICGIYQAGDYFVFKKPIPDDLAQRRKMMFLLFNNFTRLRIKTMKKLYEFQPVHRWLSNVIRHEDFVNFIHIIQQPLAEPDQHQDHPVISKNAKNDKIDISDVNIPNITIKPPHLSSLSTSQPTHPIPTHYVSSENDEICMQGIMAQRVIENLRAYHFRLKSADDQHKSTADPSSVPLIRNLFFPCPEEIEEFERLLQDDIYVLLMRSIGIERSMSRGTFKDKFFLFLNRPAFWDYEKERYLVDGEIIVEEWEEPVRKAMTALLPSIVFFLDICKCQPGTLKRGGVDYKKLSHALMRIESQILLECCANLWKKYPKMFLTTLHDSIKCLPKDVKKVEAELKQTFEKYLVSPKLDVRHHVRPSKKPKD